MYVQVHMEISCACIYCWEILHSWETCTHYKVWGEEISYTHDHLCKPDVAILNFDLHIQLNYITNFIKKCNFENGYIGTLYVVTEGCV